MEFKVYKLGKEQISQEPKMTARGNWRVELSQYFNFQIGIAAQAD